MPVTQATLDKLAKFDTPTITNVIELFDVRPRNAGYMDHRIRANFPKLPPMVGFACTAAFRSDAPPQGGDAYAGLEQQVARFAELPGPAVVVFQDTIGSREAYLLGSQTTGEQGRIRDDSGHPE